jgi:glutathione peroxidase
MKKFTYYSALLLFTFIAFSFTVKFADETSVKDNSFYSFKMTALDGEEVDFSQFKGKKVLLVNTASSCGFTPQYADLEQLREMYGQKLVILGFPANNFNQETGSNEEIAEFCQKNYGVKFQMFEKISVTGNDQHPLYQWLSKKELNGWNDEAPQWNFTKYLVNEKGELIKVFPSKVKPTDKEVIEAVNS